MGHYFSLVLNILKYIPWKMGFEGGNFTRNFYGRFWTPFCFRINWNFANNMFVMANFDPCFKPTRSEKIIVVSWIRTYPFSWLRSKSFLTQENMCLSQEKCFKFFSESGKCSSSVRKVAISWFRILRLPQPSHILSNMHAFIDYPTPNNDFPKL